MSRIKNISILAFTFVIISTLSAQFKAQLQDNKRDYPNTQQTQNSTLSLLDPEKLSMSHSFSLGLASMGKQSFSYGIYSNQLQYLISDKWTLRTSLDLVQPSSSFLPNGANVFDSQIFYGVELRYKPFDNLHFNIAVDNYPLPYSYRHLYRPVMGSSLFSGERK